MDHHSHSYDQVGAINVQICPHCQMRCNLYAKVCPHCTHALPKMEPNFLNSSQQ